MTGKTPSGDTPSQIEGVTIEVFRAEYAKADKFCQQVQDYINEAGIPALNELRNAGHHLLKSLDDNGEVANPAELMRAINHAKRACYEAGEAGVLMALKDIKHFREDFPRIQIGEVVDDYVEMMAATEKAREAVLQVRTDDEDRSNDYQLRMDAFEELRDISRKLEAARPECIVLAERARVDGRRFVTTTVLTILGIAVAAAVTISVAMGYWSSRPAAAATHSAKALPSPSAAASSPTPQVVP